MIFKRKTINVIDKGSEAYEELVADLHVCMRRLKELQEAVQELDDKYTRMRGLIYARKLHKSEPEAGEQTTEAKPMSRDELRRQLTATGRFIPGKPPVHTDK